MRWFAFFAALAVFFGAPLSFASAQNALPNSGALAGMFPFALPPLDGAPGPTDVSFLNEAPAGKHGFVRARGEHFVDGRDQPIRFWGVNLNFNGVFPSKEQAPLIAARLAKFGFNSVRLHHFEGQAAPNGLWLAPPGKTGTSFPKRPLEADPAQWDKLDFFVAELIKRGIYINFNLHVARKVSETEGFAFASALPDKDKGLAYFDEKLEADNREFARLVLTHVNPYTARAYNAEPGVCAVEVDNENSLLAMWLEGSLGKFPALYSERLKGRWNDWLRAKYRFDTPIRRAWTEINAPLTGPELLAPVGSVEVSSTSESGSVAPAPTLDYWVLNLAGAAQGRLERDEFGGPSQGGMVQPGLSARMEQSGAVAWGFQLVRDGLDVRAGQPYTLKFSARADVPRTISVNLWESRKPFRWLGVTQNVTLGSDWQDFQIGFRAADATPGQVRLTLNLGNTTGLVQVGALSLRAGGRIGAPDDWSLQRGIPLIDAKSEPIMAARRDFARFLGSLEADHIARMRTFLRGELGVRVPIWHTQAQFGGWGGVVRESAQSDAIDAHVYWKHPDFGGAGWAGANWRVGNQSMAANPYNDPLAAYALLRVPRKPFVVTEWNSGQPNDYGSESLIMAAAYAAHQDWAGVWVFDYHSNGLFERDKIENFFSIDSHPTKMATAPVAALLFRRGDVAASSTKTSLAFSLDKEWDEVANTPAPPGMGPFLKTWNNAGAPRAASLLGRVEVSSTESGYIAPSMASLATPSVLVTDTGEIVRDARRGTWTLDAPRASSWIGSWSGQRLQLGAVDARFAPGDAWHTGALVSMDGADLPSSKRMLLVLAGRAENVGMGWNPNRDSVGNQWGQGPTHVRVPQATIKLLSDHDLKVWALDARGQRRNLLSSTKTQGAIRFDVSAATRTLWFEIATE